VTATPRVGVVGLGLVGGSIVQGLAAAGADVAGYDADPAATGGAARAGLAVADDVAALARSCGVVVACVPPTATPDVVATALSADPDVVVADACSVKVPIVRDVGTPERFVPAHPLAGSAAAGWGAASPQLLRDAVWAVCPGASVPALCAVSAALEPLRTRFVACTPEDHDEALARTSHVPHLVATALARLPGPSPLAAALSGGALRDMTRTAAADDALWVEILLGNRGPALAALADLRDGLDSLAAALEAGDGAALAAAWRDGAAQRARAEALRWDEPRWERRVLEPPVWDGLLELGRAGTSVRGLRAHGDGVELEVAGAP
jgi:prephenate dehydrogenase